MPIPSLSILYSQFMFDSALDWRGLLKFIFNENKSRLISRTFSVMKTSIFWRNFYWILLYSVFWWYSKNGLYINKRFSKSLQWRHNGHDSVWIHQPHDCLLNRLFRRRSKKTWKLHVTGLCAGNSPGTGEFPAQMASYAENVSSWRRHHENGDFYNA